jgi:hypothetical protein
MNGFVFPTKEEWLFARQAPHPPSRTNGPVRADESFIRYGRKEPRASYALNDTPIRSVGSLEDLIHLRSDPLTEGRKKDPSPITDYWMVGDDAQSGKPITTR